jgi:hypothetical protein
VPLSLPSSIKPTVGLSYKDSVPDETAAVNWQMSMGSTKNLRLNRRIPLLRTRKATTAVAFLGHFKHTAHDHNGKLLIVSFDKLILHLDSREKKLITFLVYHALAGLFLILF